MSIPRLKCVTYVHPKQLPAPLLPSLLQSNLPAAPIIRVKVQPWKVKVKVVKMSRTVLVITFCFKNHSVWYCWFHTVTPQVLSCTQACKVLQCTLASCILARHTGELYTSDRHCWVAHSPYLEITADNGLSLQLRSHRAHSVPVSV